MSSKISKIPITLAMIVFFSFLISQGIESRWSLDPNKAHALDQSSSVVGSNAIVKIAKNQKPAVVNITTKAKVKNIDRGNPRHFNNFPNPFGNFNDRTPHREPYPRAMLNVEPF